MEAVDSSTPHLTISSRRAVIIGSGFLAGHVAPQLERLGYAPLCVSRCRNVCAGSWVPLDATDLDALSGLTASVRPDLVVLVHGPSDITWCEAHGAEALFTHRAIARNVAALRATVLPAECRIVLISTDNVFPGAADSYGESATVHPINRYGVAKVAAEEELAGAVPSDRLLIIRVSLVYGWQDPRATGWLNFFMYTLSRVTSGLPCEVPSGLSNTPILIDDFCAITALLIATGQSGTFHCAGPERVSRFDWATAIARSFSEDHTLVRAVDSLGTRYACRPLNACLHSERLDGVPGYEKVRPRGARAAAEFLRRHPASWVPEWLLEQQKERRLTDAA